jgi:hypothetical protein
VSAKIINEYRIGSGIFRLTKIGDSMYRSECISMPAYTSAVRVEPKIIAKYESSSKPGTYHYVTLQPDNSITCSCIGFHSPNKCWHYKEEMRKAKGG